MRERGRWTHDPTGTGTDLVVFLIGMHINKPWRPDVWIPAIRAMVAMLTELRGRPELGLLGFRPVIGWGGPAVVQYWRDVDSLYAYASTPDTEHRPAWGAFNRLARSSGGAVGIWHETFPVRRSESIYVDIPAMGLGKAIGRVPVPGRLDRARHRLEQGSLR
jgi:Monooxygenase af470-like